jgi:hypothetical protein
MGLVRHLFRFVGDKDNEKWFVQGEKGFFSTKCLRNGKMIVSLQRFKQPPEPNSGFSPKAQDLERLSPLFSFYSNPLIAFL